MAEEKIAEAIRMLTEAGYTVTRPMNAAPPPPTSRSVQYVVPNGASPQRVQNAITDARSHSTRTHDL